MYYHNTCDVADVIEYINYRIINIRDKFVQWYLLFYWFCINMHIKYLQSDRLVIRVSLHTR